LDLHKSGTIEKALKRTSTAISFKFFNYTLEYLKRLQSSEPLHAKINPTSCLSFLFDEKIRQSASLFWFGLRNVRILYSQAVIQRCLSCIFGAPFGGKDGGLSTCKL
jgi:hypothetical protein